MLTIYELRLSDMILCVNNEDIQNVLCQTALEILRTSGPIVRLVSEEERVYVQISFEI